MKIRSGFVSNSSSSSFIIVSLGSEEILSRGNTEDFESDYTSMDIDKLMEKLQKAKDAGIKTIGFRYGGGYDG